MKLTLIDRDTVLDKEDIIAIYEAEKEEKDGKLISLEELKKELRRSIAKSPQ